MSLQDYQTAIKADDDIYDIVYEYLITERLDNIQPRIWDPPICRGFSMFGFLVFKGPYLRLYALLAVILMERRNMDSMFASMINNSPFSSDLEENDPFYRKVESVEVFLQQAYEVVNKLGNALYDETSLAALVEVLPQEIGFDGLKRETQEQLLELIRLCYKCTPNSDYRGWYPNEGDQLIDDFEFRESSNEVD